MQFFRLSSPHRYTSKATQIPEFQENSMCVPDWRYSYFSQCIWIWNKMLYILWKLMKKSLECSYRLMKKDIYLLDLIYWVLLTSPTFSLSVKVTEEKRRGGTKGNLFDINSFCPCFLKRSVLFRKHWNSNAEDCSLRRSFLSALQLSFFFFDE